MGDQDNTGFGEHISDPQSVDSQSQSPDSQSQSAQSQSQSPDPTTQSQAPSFNIEPLGQESQKQSPDPVVTFVVPDEEPMDQDLNEDEEKFANSSGLNLPSVNFQVTTPSKGLPPLKDVDAIETPKTFSVARDENPQPSMVQSSPLVQNLVPHSVHSESNPDTLQIDASLIHDKENNSISLVSSYLNIPQVLAASFDTSILDALMKKAVEQSSLESEISFMKLNHEKLTQLHEAKLKSFNEKINAAEQKLDAAISEKEDVSLKAQEQEQVIADYRNEISQLKGKISLLNQTVIELEKSQNSQTYDREVIQYNNQINVLTKDNIEKNQKINELTKELNDLKNEFFTVKFDLAKASHESSYFKREKTWFENEWKSCQDRLSELSKTYQAERLTKNNEIVDLTAKLSAAESSNENLSKTVKNLNAKVEAQLNQISDLDQTVESNSIKLERELQNKDTVIEILNVQKTENDARVKELENHIDEVMAQSSDNIASLESQLRSTHERCIELEEKLSRTEEALENELRQENDLPKLSGNAELIAAGSKEFSLSSLYAEFNHLKKQLVLERSQKEKLAIDLQTFIGELESKKPIILSYKEQIAFYESSMKDMVSKTESIRIEKLESERRNSRLKNKIIELEDDLVSMKKLCKDLGKQLCYYLIHSKIRENNDNPLTLAEKNAIENIMERTGNNEPAKESDTDSLISERLVGFASIIELQKKNAELLTITRELGKKLEAQDATANNELESVAIEEAKDAILTLEGELESLKTKYDAVSKERDVLKSLSSGSGEAASGNEKYLTDMNADLKKKIANYETTIEKLKTESAQKVDQLSKKLEDARSARDELKLKVSSLTHQIELVETRHANSKATLENTNNEFNRLKESIDFWKSQSSKQENLLITKNNQVKDLESKLSTIQADLSSKKSENELLQSIQKKLQEDVEQLKNDKTQLNEFVINLQSLLKERESSNNEISSRLAQSISNYQALQEKLAERDERLTVLASQSEIALKAQNTKLEQVNELSHTLMTTKAHLEDKSRLVESLNARIKELTESLRKSDTHIKALQMNSGGTNVPSESADHSNIELEQARNELQIAESQVREYSDLAKSAEETLLNLTNAFDNHQKQSEEIQASLKKENEELREEIKRLNEQIKVLDAHVSSADSSHLDELNRVKQELEEYSVKAKNYDQLESEYNSRIETLRNELEIYSKLADENQKKYNEEQAKLESQTREIFSAKQINEELKSNIAELENQISGLNDQLENAGSVVDKEKEKIEEELNSEKLRVKDLEGQNNILLNQLELLKVPQSGDNVDEVDSTSELRQVINYVRREKESIESKNVVLSEEIQRLELRLKSTLAELETAKSELTNPKTSLNAEIAKKEHHKLLEQLEQVNILRESNTTLRNENQEYIKQIQRFEVQLKAVNGKSNPLAAEVKKLKEQIQAKEQSIRLLLEENKKLVDMANSAFNSSNDEDKQKLATLQTRFDNLLNESQTKLKAARNKEREYQKVVEQLRADVTKVNEDLTQAKQKHEQEVASITQKSKPDVNKMRQEAQANAKAELEKAKQQFQEEKNKLVSEYESKLKESTPSTEDTSEWKAKYEQLETALESTKSSLEAEYNQKLQQEVEKQVEVKIQEAKAQEPKIDEEKLRQQISEEYESKISSLKEDFSQQLEKEKQEAKAQTEKKFEIKIRMLNKKLERLESAAATANSNPSPLSGSHFNESTLTVHHPDNNGDKKRGFTPENQEQPNKKPKDV